MYLTHFETFIDAFAALTEPSRVLDGDTILCPASEDYGYQSTPKNALTFASMGVDGVHYAILKCRGAVRDDSPVVQISPMDSDDVLILAESFLQYLADGCGVSAQQTQIFFDAQRAGKPALIPFIVAHFRRDRLT